MDLKKLKKDELIQIILRKDDVERNLRADIKGMEESNDTFCDKIKSLTTECSINAASIYTLNNVIKRLRRRNYIWFTTTLLATIGLVVSLIF